jgi:adenylosuccinate lyase
VALDDLREVAEPSRFYGRAPQQVDEFLHDEVAPILARYSEPAPATKETPRV